MASLKNKIAQNRSRKKMVQKEQSFVSKKRQMQELVAEEDYVAAMDVMAEMAAMNKMDAEVMYLGALCYFRTGDYERAARWVNNALNKDNTIYAAKILLAALCFVQNRREDGLQICQFVLQTAASLSEEADLFMQDTLEAVRYAGNDVLDKYPLVKEYLKRNGMIAERINIVNTDNTENNSTENDAKSALSRLKTLLAKSKDNDADTTKISEAKVNAKGASVSKISLKSENSNSEKAFDVEDMMQKIADKPVSLTEKIKLLNSFAAACYQKDDYKSAERLLDKALHLDAYHEITLKNMIYVLLSMGEAEKAVEMTAKLPMPDFSLLYALKK